MTDDTPDLQRIVEAMAPKPPLRSEVEDAIERYVTARRAAALVNERKAGLKETRLVIRDVDLAKRDLWALLDRIPWSGE